MLDSLKRDIRRQRESEFADEAIIESVSDDSVKSAFLDDIDVSVIGAESDPEIAQLVNSIPEYEENDADVEMELEVKNLTENLVETQI